MINRLTSKVLTALIIIFVLLLSFFYVPRVFNKKTPQVSQLKTWYYLDDEVKENDKKLTLPCVLPHSKEGGDIIIYTTLPDDFTAGQSISFWSYYCAVEVYLDDKLIYYFNDANNGSFGEASSSLWNHVQISEKQPGGRELAIKLNTKYSNLYLRLTEVISGKEEALHDWIESKYYLFGMLDNMLMWIGFFFIAIAFGKKDKRLGQYQMNAGIILILFSVYMQTGIKMKPIVWMNYNTRDFLCYLSLFAIAIPITLYIRAKVARRPHMVLCCNILALFETVYMIFAFTAHALGWIDIHYTLPYALATLIIVLILAMIFSICYYIREREHYLLLNMGSVLTMIIILTVEYIQLYQSGQMLFDTGLLSHCGAILILVLEIALFSFHYLKREKRNKMIEGENENLRLQILTTQIRPHFILNTIGAIRMLIHEKPDEASELLYEFSKYIRSNLDQKDYTKPIPLLEELDYIETYLKLEKARFGDALHISYEIGNVNFWVLPLVVQPFVENAVKHGFLPSKDGGNIRIVTKKYGEKNVIEIIDDGVGFEAFDLDKMLQSKKSVGMRSAILRIEKLLGGCVKIQSGTSLRKSGTYVRIEIPD